MKTMIIYMSNCNCAKSVSRELAKRLNGEVTLSNLEENKDPNFSDFDRVIVGGSIHAAQGQKKLREFCGNNIEKLGTKELGLFICCANKAEQAFQELNNAFPDKLHQYSKAEAIFGGQLNCGDINLLKNASAEKHSKADSNFDEIDHEAVEKFAKRMDKTFAPFLMLI